MFQRLGFAVLPAEAAPNTHAATPQQLLASIMACGESWSNLPELRNQLSPTSAALWRDFPEIPRRIFRLWDDPLIGDDASLTATRNYSTYAQAMSNDAVIDRKYGDIKAFIQHGRIVDEGCADGALLIRIAKDFPDSDLIGIELTGELLARCIERQRAGEYGETFVHFHQRNLTTPIFHPSTIHTTICNSTIHELWSYNQRATTVLAYLREKYRQLAPGGRLLIRDVIGPEDGEQTVYLWLCDTDGKPWDAEAQSADVAQLSTYARFFRFAQDFLPQRRQSEPSPVPFAVEPVNGKNFIVTTLRLAAEFLLKKDYVVNWASEMHEEFAFWSITDWKRILAEIGFAVNPQSHVYTNQWIVENRWRGKAAIFGRHKHEQSDELIPLPYPPTTIILTADKPAGEPFGG
jgi:SAM-dependent methyltransferase